MSDRGFYGSHLDLGIVIEMLRVLVLVAVVADVLKLLEIENKPQGICCANLTDSRDIKTGLPSN